MEDFSDPKDVAGIIGCPLKEVDLKGGDCQAQALLFFFFNCSTIDLQCHVHFCCSAK